VQRLQLSHDIDGIEPSMWGQDRLLAHNAAAVNSASSKVP